jgi:hypothetical protein
VEKIMPLNPLERFLFGLVIPLLALALGVFITYFAASLIISWGILFIWAVEHITLEVLGIAHNETWAGNLTLSFVCKPTYYWCVPVPPAFIIALFAFKKTKGEIS